LNLDQKAAIKPQQFVALCGRIFTNTDPKYFPAAQYRGRTIRLCTESCLGAFLADADVFYKVHRNSEKGQSQDSLDLKRWREL